jgi:hypothetical protein
MRNGSSGQLGKFTWAALGGSAGGLAGGAVYAVVWGLTHWAVTGKALSPATYGPWLLALGAALGVVAGLVWAVGGLRQPPGPSLAGGRQPVPGIPGRTSRSRETTLLRRVGG